MEYRTSSPQETAKLAEKIGYQLNGGETIALVGDLGAGKTTFMTGLARGLGVATRIMSPTFVIMREHQARNTLTLYHIDLYRLETDIERELDSLGVSSIWGEKNNIVAIEWADRAKDLLPEDTIWIEFSGESDDRIIKTNYEIKT